MCAAWGTCILGMFHAHTGNGPGRQSTKLWIQTQLNLQVVQLLGGVDISKVQVYISNVYIYLNLQLVWSLEGMKLNYENDLLSTSSHQKQICIHTTRHIMLISILHQLKCLPHFKPLLWSYNENISIHHGDNWTTMQLQNPPVHSPKNSADIIAIQPLQPLLGATPTSLVHHQNSHHH